MNAIDERPRRPLPELDPDSEPYWSGAVCQELRVQRCLSEGHIQFYPRPVCVTCAGDVEWITACGRGTVYSFTVVRRTTAVPFNQLTPYVVALIDLEERVRMMSNVIDCDPDSVCIGMPVEVCFVAETDEIVLPMWRPASVP